MTTSTFKINGMTCGGCAGRIQRALLAEDADASVEINLRDKLVQVTSKSSTNELAEAIKGAGYAAERVETVA